MKLSYSPRYGATCKTPNSPAVSRRHFQSRNLDLRLMGAGLREIIGGLHAHQRVRIDAKSRFEPDCHVGRQARMAVEKRAERLARHAEMRGEILHVDTMGRDDL